MNWLKTKGKKDEYILKLLLLLQTNKDYIENDELLNAEQENNIHTFVV